MEDNPGIQACMRLNAKLTKRVDLLREALRRIHEGATRSLAIPRDYGADYYAFTAIATVAEDALAEAPDAKSKMRLRRHPMPSNAAGEWHKFDAQDKATWPEKEGMYLVWTKFRGPEVDEWGDGHWWSRYVVAYAEILPPESRGK